LSARNIFTVLSEMMRAKPPAVLTSAAAFTATATGTSTDTDAQTMHGSGSHDRLLDHGLTRRGAGRRKARLDNDTDNYIDRPVERGVFSLPRPAKTTASFGITDSHQFDPDESEAWRHHQMQRHADDLGHWWTFARVLEVRRWSLTLLTGFWVGACALFVTYFTRFLTNFKYRTFNAMIDQEKTGQLPFGAAFLFLLCCNLLFATFAWVSVYIEPLASGSGIPEIKCFLNGLNIPRLVSIKTVLCKAIGIIFSCSAGLPLGKEGPMIHIGSGVAAAVSQGGSQGMGLDASFSNVQDFRNDKEKRDFVSCGAAAGVAAAFGAPMGGVLFSFEEGASFWTTKLTWRCFFCCLTTVGSVYLINSLPNMLGHNDNGAMFSFGEFFSLEGEKANYRYVQMYVLVCLCACVLVMCPWF